MVTVECFTPQDWKKFGENAHKIAFSEILPPGQNRIDFALMPVKNGVPMGYVTCRELDSDTLYWQFGGAFPGTKSTSLSWQAYQALLGWCKERYKRVSYLVENTNLPMLKMAMLSGFRIHGVRFYKGSILVEHLVEFV